VNLRIANSGKDLLLVILEPWATEHRVAPQDFIEFRFADSVPVEAGFHVEYQPSLVVVYPEWAEALVFAFSSNGTQMD